MNLTSKPFRFMFCLLLGLLPSLFVETKAAELPPPIDGVLTITVTAEGELSSSYTVADIQAKGATCIKVIGPLNDSDILRVRNALDATLTEIDFSEAVFTTMPSFYSYGSSWSLTKIVLPEGLTEIPGSCFSGCSHLSSVNIPSTVTRIGYQVFYGCYNLPTTLTINVSGPLTIAGSAFSSTTNFTAINITAGGDVEFGSYAFTTNQLTTFELHTPGKLTTSNDPFSYSDNLLTTVTLDARGAGSKLYSYIFSGCRNLTSVTLPAGLTSIDERCFYDCPSLESLTIPASVTTIGQQAFYGCTGLGTLDFSQTALTTIGQEAFRGCTAVTNISLPAGITSVGSNAFRNCTLLTALDLSGATITEIPNSMCEECHALSSILLPATVTSIGSWAFYNCKALTSLDLSQMSFTAIPLQMCYGCELLSTLHLPANYTSIGEGAFYQCKALTTFAIPESVTEMGTQVFYQCTALTTASVQANIAQLPSSTFEGCTSLATVTLNDHITELGGSCFSGCSSLMGITLPSGLTTIGSSAFKNSAITSIDLPNRLTTIGSSAFQSCYNLTVMEVPEGVTQIPYAMMEGCGRMQSVYLPSSITEVGERALRMSPDDWNSGKTPANLIDVHVAATTPPTIGTQRQAFTTVTLYVPEASIDAYAAANIWSGFRNIYADQSDLSTLDDTEFALLQTLYTKLGGSNWTHPWTFGATKAETAIPYGVKLNEGHVVQLLLNNNNLRCSTLPQELMQFPNAWKIDLSGNHLGGAVDNLFTGMTVANSALLNLNLSDNQLTGNMGSMMQGVDLLPNLSTLKAARNRIRDVSPTLPSHISTVDLTGQDLTREKNPLTNQYYTFYELMATNTTDLASFFPSILSYPHTSSSNSYRNDYFVISSTDSSEPWAVQLYKASAGYTNATSYKSSISTWNTSAHQGALVYLSNSPNQVSQENRLFIVFDYFMGDIDYNNVVNVSDLQKLINFAIQPEAASTSTPFNFYAANTSRADDADERTIDVLDVIAEVNLLLDQDLVPTLARRDGAGSNEAVQESQAFAAMLSVENGELVLNSTQPVAALDLLLSGGSVRWSNDLNFFTKKSRGHRTIIYSLMGDVLPAGRTVLGSVDGDAAVQQAQLCDLQGDPIATRLGGGTVTGLDAVSATAAGSDIYDLQGRRIAGKHPQRGIYIIRQPGKQGKKMIK